ncbi:MAG TPA: hypothetical protein VKS03_08750, partial [Thermoanaerobaculia bacterium]|nr:hypothetical protein [Thermoanaerobaculia bacterium]
MRIRGARRCRLLAAAAVLAVGCSSSVPIPDGAQLTCATASDCPSGYLCHNGTCATAGAIDTTPPDLVSVTVSPAAPWDSTAGFGKAGTTFAIDLVATEPLLEPPKVTIGTVPQVTVSCARTGGDGYRCTYQASGTENGGYGGVVKFDVWLEDLARNETTRNRAGALDLDFEAPKVASANVSYYPDPSNPLPSVKRAAAGTVVHVAVSADELLDGVGGPPTASVDFGGGPVAFGLVSGSMTATGAAFEVAVPAGTPDGLYTPTVTWTDLAGNTGTASIGAQISVKTSRPVLDVNQAAVVFVRSPWGNAAAERLGGSGYTIPAGPYFALEPSDPLSPGATLAAGTFMLADGSVPSAVLVENSATAGALILGTLRPDASGTFPRQALSSPDLATVYVVGIDDAGNDSAAVKIHDAEWVATLEPPATGTNPNALEWVGSLSSTRDQDIDVHPSDRSSLLLAGGSDGQAILARAEAAWRDWTSTGAAPPGRGSHAMAYDSARGRIVVYGGVGTAYLDDTWEWNGSNWTRAA